MSKGSRVRLKTSSKRCLRPKPEKWHSLLIRRRKLKLQRFERKTPSLISKHSLLISKPKCSESEKAQFLKSRTDGEPRSSTSRGI
jgi:hypothetical protein